MSWCFDSQKPVFIQIAAKLRTDILSGKYQPDEQIPTVRQLAYEASVNPNTMQKALTQLESEKLLFSKGTTGRFVTSDADVLAEAAESLKRERMAELVSEAKSLGITKEDIIAYFDCP